MLEKKFEGRSLVKRHPKEPMKMGFLKPIFHLANLFAGAHKKVGTVPTYKFAANFFASQF